MAKNLKLNIKNAQLAEALKLSQPKKTLPKKEKKEPAELPAEPVSVQELSTPEPAPKLKAASKQKTAKPAPSLEKEPAQEEQPLTPPESVHLPKFEQEEPQLKKILPGFAKKEPEPFRSDSSRYSPSYEQKERATPYPVKKEGSVPYPVRRENAAPYPVKREGAAPYPVRREGAAPYPVRRDATPGAARPPFKREGAGDFKPDARRPLPPKEPGKELPQQQQTYKKPTPQFSTDKDSKTLKKPGAGNSFDSRDRQGLRDSDDEKWRKRKPIKSKQQLLDEVIRPKELKIRLPITVKDLAVEMKLKASQLIAKLFMQGVVITLNDYLDDETTIQLLGHEFDCEISIDTTEEERIRVTDKTIKAEITETDPTLLKLRAPIITFMGHVDHGKTSLIDTIRKTNTAAGEAGAITQHIGAFKCQTDVGVITVLDTPGHEAFSSMRERGAEVTDIVVLVIAGDEGIRTQTVEAINQAKEAGVSLVVAINKCDKPNFDQETVYRQLADQNLLPEAWGGSVITVNCSAVTGQGIKELLEMLALQAEVLELRANPDSRARGSVIESEMHKGLGSVATILVQNGTLRLGDSLVFDQLYAKVKTMHDEHGKELSEASPSTPVRITGLSGMPLAGSEFIVVKNEKEAKEISQKRDEGQKHVLLQQNKKASLENFLQNKADSSGKKTLNLILKADVQGSLEALKSSLRKLPSNKVEINFISEGVGEVSESDIQYAATSKATILGFHTRVESHAEGLIKQTKADVRLHDIIYHAVDDIRAVMLSLLDKIPKENEMGEAQVRAVFKSSQLGNIAGCQVTEGIIKKSCQARLLRGKDVIWKGPIASLKRNKDDVKEAVKGFDCGILLQGFTDFQENDIIQAYEIIYLQQELS